MKGQFRRNALVPIDPIRRVLTEWAESQDVTGQDVMDIAGRGREIEKLAPISVLASHTGLKEDTLYSIKGRKDRKFVDFDLADKIISFIDVNLWRSDDELRDIYENFDFTLLDVSRPTGGRNELDELIEGTNLSKTKIARLLGVHHTLVYEYQAA